MHLWKSMEWRRTLSCDGLTWDDVSQKIIEKLVKNEPKRYSGGYWQASTNAEQSHSQSRKRTLSWEMGNGGKFLDFRYDNLWLFGAWDSSVQLNWQWIRMTWTYSYNEMRLL